MLGESETSRSLMSISGSTSTSAVSAVVLDATDSPLRRIRGSAERIQGCNNYEGKFCKARENEKKRFYFYTFLEKSMK